MPLRRPRCCFLNFTFFGISMMDLLPRYSRPRYLRTRGVAGPFEASIGSPPASPRSPSDQLECRDWRQAEPRPTPPGGKGTPPPLRFEGGWTHALDPSAAPGSRRRPSALLLQQVALVHPDLDADHAVGGACLGEAVIDVGLQRVQRQPPFLVPLGARDLVSAQPAGDHDLDPLGAEAEGRFHRLLHRPAGGGAPPPL